MRRVLIATAILAVTAVTAVPSFATDASTPDQRPAMRQMMQQHPEMMQAMTGNPHHLLMMTYHKNVMLFGQMLAQVARQGDTVPRDVAQTAVSEMRRSVNEMEKQRAEAMRSMPAGVKPPPEMQTMMDRHLVDVKNHLRQLEDLSRKDRVPSEEVIKHLQAIFEGCGEMGCGHMHSRGEHCDQMQGAGGGCGCNKMATGSGHDCASMASGAGHMQEMVQKMKAQDAEMAQQVARMKQAPREKKVDLMAEIVTQLVQQRADLTAHMEKMQHQHHMMHGQGAKHQGMYHGCGPVPPPPGTPMFNEGEGPDDEPDMNMDDMEMNDNDVTE